jgi:hypothetical protein
MAITEHPSRSQPAPIAALPATIPQRATEAPQPHGFPATWADEDVAATAGGVPGPASAELLTLGPLWPFIVILAVLALIVPFLAGLVLVALAGAVLLPAYLLRRHRRR